MAALSYIPAGTSIKFDVSGSADGFDDSDATAAVRQQLSKYFNVQRVYLDAQTIFEYSGWPFRAEVVISTKEAYGAIEDVASIVAGATYDATGYMPSVSAPSYGGPTQDTPSTTGIGEGIKSIADTIGDAIGRFVKGATEPVTNEINTVLIVVAIVAVVLVVSAAGKTTKVGVAL